MDSWVWLGGGRGDSRRLGYRGDRVGPSAWQYAISYELVRRAINLRALLRIRRNQAYDSVRTVNFDHLAVLHLFGDPFQARHTG